MVSTLTASMMNNHCAARLSRPPMIGIMLTTSPTTKLKTIKISATKKIVLKCGREAANVSPSVISLPIAILGKDIPKANQRPTTAMPAIDMAIGNRIGIKAKSEAIKKSGNAISVIISQITMFRPR